MHACPPLSAIGAGGGFTSKRPSAKLRNKVRIKHIRSADEGPGRRCARITKEEHEANEADKLLETISLEFKNSVQVSSSSSSS